MMEGEGDSNDVIVISDDESSDTVIIVETPSSTSDPKDLASVQRAIVLNTVKSVAIAAYADPIPPCSDPEAMRWLRHRRPSVVMTGRIQFTIGFILVDVMATAAGTPEERIMQSKKGQRMLQKYIYNRLKAILIGNVVGLPLTIMESYREIYPEATDREVVDKIVKKIHAKKQARNMVKRRKMRSSDTQSTSTVSAAQATASLASLSRVLHYRPVIEDYGECSSNIAEQDSPRENSKRKHPHTITSSEASDDSLEAPTTESLQTPQSLAVALISAPQASNNAPEATDNAQKATDNAKKATDDVPKIKGTVIQVLMNVLKAFSESLESDDDVIYVPNNE